MDFNRKIIPFLSSWLKQPGRKPLLIRGARQVGKTKAVTLFCKKHGLNLIHLNLEKVEHKRLFQNDISLAEFEKIIDSIFKKSLNSSNTLLFIDEIQEVPYLLTLLRFFYEDKPNLPVIATGSLLEVRLKHESLSIPVGRVEFAYMYPLDFFEFLNAIGETKTLDLLKSFDFKTKLPLAIHERCLSLFYEYVLVGGMPEAVKLYAQDKSISLVNQIYSNLFTSFKDDVYKYTSLTQAKYVSFILEHAPEYAGQTITYEKFANSKYKHREMSGAFTLIEQAMLLTLIRSTKSINLPINASYKSAPKLLFLDTGLVNFLTGIQNEFINLKDLNSLYQGRIAEQIVGQQLLATQIYTPLNLFYWQGKKNTQAEVDFCLTYEGKLIGFEVKSATYGKMRSAHVFLKKTKSIGQIIRIYSGEFMKQKGFVSLPFYLLPKWQEVV